MTAHGSPEYYRRFIREWCGGVDADCKIYVTTGKRAPHVESGAIEVGAEWLRKQCVPAEALEDDHA
jgi:hypothetical protein